MISLFGTVAGNRSPPASMQSVVVRDLEMGFLFRLLVRAFLSDARPKRRYRGSVRSKALRPGARIRGKAYVIDGDTIRVSRVNIRLAGLDALETDQVAKHQDGYWFKQGQRVKSALINEIGGKVVSVAVHGYDKYGRVVGTVSCDGRDINEWLVWNGHAIAAYGEQHRHVELDAQRAQRGMWAYAARYDPRTWRHDIQDNARSR